MLDQNALLFNIVLKNTKHNLSNNKRKAVIEETDLVTSIVPSTLRTLITIKEDDYTGEIFSEVKALVTQFVGLFQREITKVFFNQFRPINLYEFHLMRDRNNPYYEYFQINEDTLKMCKVTSLYKDYESTNTLRSKTFLNYIIIIMPLFGLTISRFYLALLGFHQEIIKLSTVYE